ncbi:hypothetical protein U9M48_037187 [Paspalum notatum var. saurae]|uniref:Reverse transcriptase domain-containing protein n=1 Tax=Paspalum notatum var. saurae TaxID=547442 RepID=A0AAQ3UIR8_PASNO
MMNMIFMKELDLFVVVFIDDIMIFSKIREEHEQHLRVVLKKLRENQLYEKFSKCEFWLEKVASWECQWIQKKLKLCLARRRLAISFLGLAGYYRRFMENFSKVAKPMTGLLKNDVPFKWDEKCEEMLTLPDLHKDFVVYSDASRQGLGCVLMQDNKVVPYASGS